MICPSDNLDSKIKDLKFLGIQPSFIGHKRIFSLFESLLLDLKVEVPSQKILYVGIRDEKKFPFPRPSRLFPLELIDKKW